MIEIEAHVKRGGGCYMMAEITTPKPDKSQVA